MEGARSYVEPISPVFPYGPVQVKCEMHSVFPPEFTTIAHNKSLLKWFLRQSMVVLLNIHANCLLFAPKSANPSRLLPAVVHVLLHQFPAREYPSNTLLQAHLSGFGENL